MGEVIDIHTREVIGGEQPTSSDIDTMGPQELILAGANAIIAIHKVSSGGKSLYGAGESSKRLLELESRKADILSRISEEDWAQVVDLAIEGLS